MISSTSSRSRVQRSAAFPYRICRRSFNVSPGPVRQRVARKGAGPAPAITQREGNTGSLDGNSTKLGVPRPELQLELCPLRELPPSPVEEIPIQFNVSRRAHTRARARGYKHSQPSANFPVYLGNLAPVHSRFFSAAAPIVPFALGSRAFS